MLGALCALFPKPTKALIEASVRTSNADGRLRLSAVERTAKLTELHRELRQAEARLEMNRRKIEASGAPALPRHGYDPGVWLLPDPELAAMVKNGGGS